MSDEWRLITLDTKFEAGVWIVVGWRQADGSWAGNVFVPRENLSAQELLRDGITHWAEYPAWILRGPLQ